MQIVWACTGAGKPGGARAHFCIPTASWGSLDSGRKQAPLPTQSSFMSSSAALCAVFLLFAPRLYPFLLCCLFPAFWLCVSYVFPFFWLQSISVFFPTCDLVSAPAAVRLWYNGPNIFQASFTNHDMTHMSTLLISVGNLLNGNTDDIQ